MRVLAGEPKPHQENGSSQNALEVSDHRDGAALSYDHGLAAEGRRQRATGSVVQRALQVGAPRATPVQGLHGDGDTLRSDTLDMRPHERSDLFGILIRNETTADLRH